MANPKVNPKKAKWNKDYKMLQKTETFENQNF